MFVKLKKDNGIWGLGYHGEVYQVKERNGDFILLVDDVAWIHISNFEEVNPLNIVKERLKL